MAAYNFTSLRTLNRQHGAFHYAGAIPDGHMSSKRQCPKSPGEPSERQPVVLVDMDGTIADFDARVYALVAAGHPEVRLPPFEQRVYPLSRGVPASQRPLVTALFKEVGFFREMAPIEGAIEALHQMVAEGINVRLCTSPLSSSPRCASEKIEWVVAHLGQA